MNVTIAIPTWNRCKPLSNLIDSIEKIHVPQGVNLYVAISNSGSNDETSIYLDILKFSNPDKYFIHNKLSLTANWYTLMKIIPEHTDYVWLIGDDDEILNFKCVDVIYSKLKKQAINSKAIFMPMKKRVNEQGCETGTLSKLCNKYGFHEVLGWMSAYFIQYKYFKIIFEMYGQKVNYRAMPSKKVYESRIGLFLHSTQTYKVLFNKKVTILFSDFVDEQAYERNLKTIIESSGYRKKKFYSGRFFFDLEEINQINLMNKFKPNRVFFKYVNRDFLLLLYQIAFEGAKSREFRKIETLNQIKILEDAFRSLKISGYSGFYLLVNGLVNKLLFEKNGHKITTKSTDSIFKQIEYSNKINEIYIK